MYRETIKVKYSDLDNTLTASLPAMLTFYQNAAIDHSRDRGFPLRRLYGEKHAWILISINTEIYHYPEEGEEIFVNTFTTGYERVFGKRSFFLTDKDGKEISRASTLWVFTDIESRKPCRIPEEIKSAYDTEKCEVLPYLRRETDFIKGEPAYTIVAGKRDTDTNNHVNNVRISEYMMEAVPLGTKVSSAKIFYHSAIYAGDTITSFVHKDNNRYHVCLENSDKKLVSSAQFELGSLENENF